MKAQTDASYIMYQ